MHDERVKTNECFLTLYVCDMNCMIRICTVQKHKHIVFQWICHILTCVVSL